MPWLHEQAWAMQFSRKHHHCAESALAHSVHVHMRAKKCVVRVCAASTGLLACMQMLQTPLEATESSGAFKARVHKGFLATWTADGIRDAVLEAVKDLTAPHDETEAGAGPSQEQPPTPRTHVEVCIQIAMHQCLCGLLAAV